MTANRQLKALELLINQGLKLDALALAQLQGMIGKSVHIECTEPVLQVLISITDSGIRLDRFEQQPVTSHLTGDLSAFTALLTATDKVAALINGNLRLQGDSQMLMDLQKILQSLDLDWEYQLARVIGDLPAHWLGKMSRDTFGWLRSTRPIFMRHLQEFIIEEARLSPTPQELEQYIGAVQETVESVERLEARLNRLKQHPAFSKETP